MKSYCSFQIWVLSYVLKSLTDEVWSHQAKMTAVSFFFSFLFTRDLTTHITLHKPLVSCLRPSMCSYDGELLHLDFSVHVLFPSYRDSDLYLPLYD